MSKAKIYSPNEIDQKLGEISEDIQITDEQIEFESEKPLIIRIKDRLEEKFQFRNNALRQVIEFRNNTARSKWQDFEEEDLNTLWIDFQLDKEFRGREKPSKNTLDIMLKSRLVDKFNPIHAYFKALKWDGTDHIAQLADIVHIKPTVIHTKDKKHQIEALFYSLLKRWLISATSCGLGISQNHVMLLLVGGQGTGKTTFLDKLCPTTINNYLFTGHINPEDKNTWDLLAEKFIINIDDQLQSIFQKDFHKIKGLITAPSVTNRKAYRRDEKKRPRIANFVGSVNKEKIFEDVENRRYLTFPIVKVDYEKNIDIDQVWAQAYHLLNTGQQPWFNAEETQLINAINAHFSFESPEEEFLAKMYKSLPATDLHGKPAMFNEILSNMSKASGMRLNSNRLTTAMKRLEWNETTSQRINGQPRHCYWVHENFMIDDYGKIKIREEV